jgi:hypothetical protein
MTHLQNLCFARIRVEVSLQQVFRTSTTRSTVIGTLYTSYVSSEDTAINSAEHAPTSNSSQLNDHYDKEGLCLLVTAKNRRIKRAAAPDFPSRAVAAAAAGSPAETSAGESTRMSGSPRRATAARPRVVASVNGIANLV